MRAPDVDWLVKASANSCREREHRHGPKRNQRAASQAVLQSGRRDTTPCCRAGKTT